MYISLDSISQIENEPFDLIDLGGKDLEFERRSYVKSYDDNKCKLSVNLGWGADTSLVIVHAAHQYRQTSLVTVHAAHQYRQRL